MSDEGILDNAVLLIVFGIIGFIMIILGSAFESVFLGLAGSAFVAIPLLRLVFAIIGMIR